MRFMAVSIVVLLLAFVAATNCESDGSLPTSVAGMEHLLKIETLLIQTLQDYGAEVQKKLNTIHSAIERMQKEHAKSIDRTEEYLSNPISAYALVRRMHQDWIYWELYMREVVGGKQIETLQSYLPNLPGGDDYEEAVTAINRIQVTYNLRIAELAEGVINGKRYDVMFSVPDCYALGFAMLARKRYQEAGQWFYAAINKYIDDPVYEVFGITRLKLFQIYGETLFKQNRTADALKMMDIALDVEPHNTDLIKRKADMQMIAHTSNPTPNLYPPTMANAYELGCRGAFVNRTSRMYCVYNTTTTAFLRLAPLKMEIIHLDPFMVLFHDVISDAEISELQTMARPQLKRATVYNDGNSKSEVVSRRTSKFAWFYDKTSNTTERINRRIMDMSGFDLNGSEMLQVMNYGLGGHYDTHYDFFNLTMDNNLVKMQGDRISTVLFYLTNVEQGGATVFPSLLTSVFPQKGSAIMWYNLNNQGEGDWRTVHAACPVLVGSKWVCNKWIRERNQMLRRPCYK